VRSRPFSVLGRRPVRNGFDATARRRLHRNVTAILRNGAARACCSRCDGKAPVAQGIEHRFPKPGVAGSNPAGGANASPGPLFRSAGRKPHHVQSAGLVREKSAAARAAFRAASSNHRRLKLPREAPPRGALNTYPPMAIPGSSRKGPLGETRRKRETTVCNPGLPPFATGYRRRRVAETETESVRRRDYGIEIAGGTNRPP
jgi:hypothetical protein